MLYLVLAMDLIPFAAAGSVFFEWYLYGEISAVTDHISIYH